MGAPPPVSPCGRTPCPHAATAAAAALLRRYAAERDAEAFAELVRRHAV